jgi:acyl-CoA thioesterase-2
MTSGIAGFLELLDLEAIETNIFRGAAHLPEARNRVFGGQVAAQALVAAGRTVDIGRVHSLHSYFLRPGDPTIPILYQVDRSRDGRSFATRRVVAIQHGEPIFNFACSFHHDEPGLEHEDPMPIVPSPEELPALNAVLPAIRAPGTALGYLDDNGVDLRFVTVPPWEEVERAEDRVQLWLRTSQPLADEPLLHAAIATFISDLTLVGTILRRHALSLWHLAGRSYFSASLDHSMWFHRPFRVDEWLLYDQRSPAAHGARGLSIGSLYSQQGHLVATIAQEGLIRVNEAERR